MLEDSFLSSEGLSVWAWRREADGSRRNECGREKVTMGRRQLLGSGHMGPCSTVASHR